MLLNVYERVLQLMEAEGIRTLFGIPDPSLFHMFVTAEKRGWRIIAPHHEQAGAFMAEGYCAYGEYVEREEDIAPAIARALASGKPAVIQIPIDSVANARDIPGHEEYSTWYNDFF